MYSTQNLDSNRCLPQDIQPGLTFLAIEKVTFFFSFADNNKPD